MINHFLEEGTLGNVQSNTKGNRSCNYIASRSWNLLLLHNINRALNYRPQYHAICYLLSTYQYNNITDSVQMQPSTSRIKLVIFNLVRNLYTGNNRFLWGGNEYSQARKDYQQHVERGIVWFWIMLSLQNTDMKSIYYSITKFYFIFIYLLIWKKSIIFRHYFSGKCMQFIYKSDGISFSLIFYADTVVRTSWHSK